MPKTRRLVSAVAAATVALPLTVVLAAPAVADDPTSGRAYAWRWSGGSSDGQPYGQPYGQVYGQPYVSPYGALPQSPYGQGYGSPYGQGSSSTSTAGLDTSAATDTQEAGLVTISTVVDYGEGEAAGTGIVLSSDGIVVTNHHVVEGATSIKVTVVSTGQTYTADLVGSSTRKDVAVLRLEGAGGLTAVSTDTAAATVGQDVTAVGDAGGDGGTLTAAPGTVSALKQKITVSDDETGGKHRLRNLVEVTSDIIPGDSGGALLDADGDVIGMNVAASSGTADVTGYVIPMSRVLRVGQAILAGQTTGDIELGYRAFLGIQLRASGDSPTIAGVVEDSPAAGAGLAAGDTVTAVDGTSVSTAKALRAAIAAHPVGDSVTVTWTDSSGASHTAAATLTRAPVA